ncbi:MAG: hypothetical protein AB1631_31670 [Acidobacteriota bacterium]
MTQSSLQFDLDGLALVRLLCERATREKPVSLRRLREELRRVNVFASDRTVKGYVEHLRREGVLIGSNRQEPYGYWTPRTEAEEDELLHSYLKQAYSSLRTAREMMRHTRRARERGAGQMVMEFVREEIEI